jgi:hypothetical protein
MPAVALTLLNRIRPLGGVVGEASNRFDSIVPRRKSETKELRMPWHPELFAAT